MYGMLLIAAGIGMLLGGLFCMRFGLKRILSQRIQFFLSQITVNPWCGLLVGIIASALLQGSTAVSLITIGLVSANYLSFYQSLGIILGANIGTCTTVQLMASLSIPEEYLYLLLGVWAFGVLVIRQLRYTSLAAAGLIIMFLGLSTLSKALSQFSQMNHVVQYIMAARYDPLYGILAGAAITVLFQSSSAATGVLMVLAEQGLIDLTTAAYIVYGNNIGSCLSSVIVGATAPLAAKRVAVAHILLNVIGVFAFLPVTNLLVTWAVYLSTDFAEQIALMHTIFNVICSLAVMPVINYYADFVVFLVPGGKSNYKGP